MATKRVKLKVVPKYFIEIADRHVTVRYEVPEDVAVRFKDLERKILSQARTIRRLKAVLKYDD